MRSKRSLLESNGLLHQPLEEISKFRDNLGWSIEILKEVVEGRARNGEQLNPLENFVRLMGGGVHDEGRLRDARELSRCRDKLILFGRKSHLNASLFGRPH